MEETIPVIDLEKISEQEECKKLREACEKWGCFRIINHSIPLTLMGEMKMVVGALLDLPMEIKKRNKEVIAGSGYMAPSAINPLYEALGLYDLGSSQAVQDFCSQLDATPHQRFFVFVHSLDPSLLLFGMNNDLLNAFFFLIKKVNCLLELFSG